MSVTADVFMLNLKGGPVCLTCKDPLSLPQRVGHAVDVVVDVVGGAGQFLDGRLQVTNGLPENNS